MQRNSRAIVMTEVGELGGAERACIALASWLFRQSLPCRFVTYYDAAGLAKAATFPLEVIELSPALRPLAKINALSRYFADRPNPFQPLMSGYQPALHATLAGMRGFHCMMHDTPSLFSDATQPHFPVKRWVSDSITGYGLRSGGSTIVTSTYLREESQRVFDIDAVIARMGGLGSGSGEEFRPRSAGSTLRMLSVSRIESNKRVDWILRALATLEHRASPLSRAVDWQLDIAGRGSQLAAMRSLSVGLGLEQRVHFHGFVSDAQLQELYARADLFLMPAVQGYGIPAIESLQRGIPVLLHHDSGVSDILLHTPWATVFDGSEESMLPALERAISSVRENRQIGSPLPVIPTEDSWAEQVATICGWL